MIDIKETLHNKVILNFGKFIGHMELILKVILKYRDHLFWKKKLISIPKIIISIKRVRISSTFSVLRLFSYLRPFLYFDRSTSTSLLRTLYLDSLRSTSVLRHFVKSSYWSTSTGRSTVLVEVKFWSK